MVVWSVVAFDPRVEREARALAASGFRVTIYSIETVPPSPTLDWGPGIVIKPLPDQVFAPLRHFPWVCSAALLNVLRRETASAYHAHDLSMVLPTLVAAAEKGVPCVCDLHEWYSENVTYHAQRGIWLPHSWLKRRVYQCVERLALRCASRVVTVCDSIANELRRQYHSPRPLVVVRNIPRLEEDVASHKPTINVRRQLAIPDERQILLYQGGVGPARALEPIIQAMGLVRSAAFVIRGPFVQYYQQGYLQLARKVAAVDRVFCLPPVPPERCVIEAQAADFGIWSLLPICRNFVLALPNKVFEYLAAGLPVVCAHHPEVRKIVEGHRVGLCFDPESPASIAAAIDRMAEDADLRRSCRANIPAALAALRADREWAKLVDMYRHILPIPGSSSLSHSHHLRKVS
jgi:glycosyltransferase involved in cell wall biosynthesis